MSVASNPAPPGIIGTPAYYQWRYDDFIARNPNQITPDYYLNYGLKYAQRFQNETSNRLSSQGKKWIAEVMTNLQTLMGIRLIQPDGATLERNARALHHFAFASHVEAYWNENGTAPLYDLPFSDLLKILFTPDFRDLIRPKSLWQITTIVCKLSRYRFAQLFNRAKIVLLSVRRAN